MRPEQRLITTSRPFPAVADSDQGHGRVDHNFSDSDSMFGRYSYSTAPTLSPAGLPYTGSNEYTKASSLTVQETHIFSPTTVNQFRVAWTFFDDLLIFPTTPSNVTASEFGLQNLNPPGNALGVAATERPRAHNPRSQSISARRPAGEHLFAGRRLTVGSTASTVGNSVLTEDITGRLRVCSRRRTGSSRSQISSPISLELPPREALSPISVLGCRIRSVQHNWRRATGR